jgi:hypothetical protein
MKLLTPFSLVLLILLAACQSAETETPVLPTQMVLPTLIPSNTPTLPPSETPTPSLTPTPTNTPTPTMTFTPSKTPTNTPVPSNTPNPTSAAVLTSTAVIEQRPIIATLTPPPPGSVFVPTTTPVVLADVRITEAQFQQQINDRIKDMSNVQSALVNFVAAQGDQPAGIKILLTADAGNNVFATGTLFIPVPTSTDFIEFQGQLIVDPNAPPPSDEFIQFATGDFFVMVIQTLDGILKQRLGDQQDLQMIRMTNDALEITLLVPEHR